jgi:hypothetical protein
LFRTSSIDKFPFHVHQFMKFLLVHTSYTVIIVIGLPNGHSFVSFTIFTPSDDRNLNTDALWCTLPAEQLCWTWYSTITAQKTRKISKCNCGKVEIVCIYHLVQYLKLYF